MDARDSHCFTNDQNTWKILIFIFLWFSNFYFLLQESLHSSEFYKEKSSLVFVFRKYVQDTTTETEASVVT